jgi:hypothetical protein
MSFISLAAKIPLKTIGGNEKINSKPIVKNPRRFIYLLHVPGYKPGL